MKSCSKLVQTHVPIFPVLDLLGIFVKWLLEAKYGLISDLASVTIYPATIKMMEKGIRTGVTLSNKESAEGCVQLERELPREREMILI